MCHFEEMDTTPDVVLLIVKDDSGEQLGMIELFLKDKVTVFVANESYDGFTSKQLGEIVTQMRKMEVVQ